jgi:hypothetical protein
LAKKYKILQSLKATRKQSSSYQIFSLLKELNPWRLSKDPIKMKYFYGTLFYFFLFILALIILQGYNLIKKNLIAYDFSSKDYEMGNN